MADSSRHERFAGLRAVARDPDDLAHALLYLGLLVCAGASLGLLFWELSAGDALFGFLQTNRHAKVGFGRALPLAATFALIAAGIGALRLQRGVPALIAAARISSPLIVAPLVPPMLFWEAWVQKPIVFLVLCAIAGLGLRRALESAFEAAGVERWVSAARERAANRSGLAARLASAAPLTVVACAAAAYAAYFTYYTLLNHWNLHTNSYDLGIFDNVFWNALDRFDPNLPSSPFNGPDARHLAIHATFIVFALLPFYALHPTAETLLVIQSVGIGLAAVPLYFLARRRLQTWAAVLVAVLYLLYAPLHGPNLYDFHFMTLAPLLVWTTVWLLETRHDKLAVLGVFLCLMTREDIAAGVAIMGAYMIATRQRPAAGLLIAVIAVVYTGLLKLVIMPGGLHAGGGSFLEIYRGLLPDGKGGFGAVLGTVFSNPGYTLGTLLTKEKLLYALQLSVPLAFLPWTRPIGALCTVPGILFALLVTHAPPLTQISFHYTVHFTTYLFLALLIALEWIGKPPDSAPRPHAQYAALGALVLCIVLTSHQFGAILQQHTAQAGYGGFVFGTTPKQQQDYKALQRIIAKIPKDASVVASEQLVPHISNRRFAYTLRINVYDAQYMLSPMHEALPVDLAACAAQLRSGAFGVVETDGRFMLAKRGASTARNAGVIKRIR